MKINNKIFYMANLVFSALGVISVFLINMDIAFVFLGFSQLFTGLDRFAFGEDFGLKENQKGNKYVGMISIVVGIVIIIVSIRKLII